MKSLEETEFDAFRRGPYRKAILRALDIGAKRLKAADGRLDVGTGRVARHVSDVV